MVNRRHPVRPVVIIDDLGDACTVLLCGHDELRLQADGTITLVSDYYSNNPQYKILPWVLVDRQGTGFLKPTYVNLYSVKMISKSRLDPAINGYVSVTDATQMSTILGLDFDSTDVFYNIDD